jgi:hypothetical protein
MLSGLQATPRQQLRRGLERSSGAVFVTNCRMHRG